MRRFGIWANVQLTMGTCTLLAAAISTLPVLGASRKTGPEVSRSGRSLYLMPTASRCETLGRDKITIRCEYTATPRSASEDVKTTRIVLNSILISFEAIEESHMHVDLTFTNGGTTQISDAHTPYLVIDDEAGQNHVRRILQQVDFRKIAPGQRLTFSEWLFIGSFRPGHYTIYLWIPDPDPSLKFSTAHNFLLSSVGVPDPQTGMNTLASFTVMP